MEIEKVVPRRGYKQGGRPGGCGGVSFLFFFFHDPSLWFDPAVFHTSQ